ncbi:putative leucine-rich repeat receptor-like serine/threonine-protein kinase [Forsythia ovata]|uniref:non-specific serine/threonine protein kinase n=1 Tax=Forsythia ovata TaxID=205694 RepID=A0ABD1NUR2_9LAMI
MLEMKVDEIHSVLGEDEDAEAMRAEIQHLWARLAFSEDARTRATYDVTKVQTIQKACVVTRKKAESQLKSCQSMIQAKDKELTEALNELTKAKGLLAKLGVPGYIETELIELAANDLTASIDISVLQERLTNMINLVKSLEFAGDVNGSPVVGDVNESLNGMKFLLSRRRQIGKTLGKEWNFSVDPCSGGGNWNTSAPNPPKGYNNTVTCNCSYESNTICHVVSISLKAQSLPGSVPREMVRLPYLQVISLLGNRITGPIPGELANISTLEDLVLEYNQLSGNIPLQFGNFSSIKRILLTSNNLTGELPATLAKLTTLKEFRIGDNKFSGSIPNFIENWTSLDKLFIQGSGLSGPIPSGIASMTNLSDLRISDLNGNDSTFPPLNNTKNLERLILRSCNITGEIPIFVGTMTKLKVLDLSFNKLSGPIPVNFEDLSKTGYIYLTGNSLTGPLPPWMLKDGESIDLSYNNLMSESTPPNCQPRNLNLFESSKGNTTGITSCLRDFRCEKKYYFLRINCGGREVKVDDKGTTYEADGEPGGSSYFLQSKTNWAFSSTGHFLDDYIKIDSYIRDNISSISGQNPELYMNARLSPLSLTYYGFCLENGNYTVKLHFAEIMFTDDRNYSSLGRRIFDVYVQGTRVLKDFNIENEAGGVNKAIVRHFTAAVTAKTVEIRLYWAGKGTTGIPDRGVYGPLISAISVNADFPVPSENGKSMSTGAIVGIIVAVLFTILLVLGILWWKGCLGSKDTIGQDLKGLELHTGSFPLRQIKAATNNFDPANKIGEGGFGPVYKGLLSDGTIIAVKQLSSKSKQWES